MKKTIKSLVAVAAASFMCAVPTVASVNNVPVVTSITASAASTAYPEASSYMGVGYATQGLLFQIEGDGVALAGRVTNVSNIKVPRGVTINGKQYVVRKIKADAFNASIDGKWINNYNHYKYETSINSLDLTEATYLNEIGERAFRYQTLSTVNLKGGNLYYICDNAFEGCYRIKNLDIPSTVREIGQGAFYCCSGIQTLKFYYNSRYRLKINDKAFANCVGLTQIQNNNWIDYNGSASNAFSIDNAYAYKPSDRKTINVYRTTTLKSYNELITQFKSKFSINK